MIKHIIIYSLIFLISIHLINCEVKDYSGNFTTTPNFLSEDAAGFVKLQFQTPPGKANDYISLRYPNDIKFVIILISVSCENNQYRLCSSLNVGIFGVLEENEVYFNNDEPFLPSSNKNHQMIVFPYEGEKNPVVVKYWQIPNNPENIKTVYNVSIIPATDPTPCSTQDSKVLVLPVSSSKKKDESMCLKCFSQEDLDSLSGVVRVNSTFFDNLKCEIPTTTGIPTTTDSGLNPKLVIIIIVVVCVIVIVILIGVLVYIFLIKKGRKTSGQAKKNIDRKDSEEGVPLSNKTNLKA